MWAAMLTRVSSKLVRVRNALLLRRGTPKDFDWTPDTVPASFKVERRAAPPAIGHALNQCGIHGIEDDWLRALAIVKMLLRNAQDRGPIQADLETTFSEIGAGRGYCADYVRVYIAAAVGANLFCRQWAFSFDGFGGHGHTVVEVYDRDRERWRFLDVYNNVYAVRSRDEIALSVGELRALLASDSEAIEFRKAAEGRLGMPEVHKLRDYYRRGAGEWYLWFGNDVISRDRAVFARILKRISGRLSHRLGGGLGNLPALVAVADPANDADIVRMEALCRNVWLISVAAIVGAAMVVISWK